MAVYRRYSRPAPPGSVVVRIVEAGGGLHGFVREVEEDDTDDTYPTEQKPLDQVWRLVENKRQDAPDTPVYVELEVGIDWNDAWGRLEG